MVTSVLVASALVYTPAAATAAPPNPVVPDQSVPLKELLSKVPPFPTMPAMSVGGVKWPVAGTAVLDLLDASGRGVEASATVGGLPVKAGPAAATDPDMTSPSAIATEAPAQARIEVLSPEVSTQAGYPLLLRVSRVDGRSEGGRVSLEVDYSAFSDAFGADWANRLTIVSVPACALQTPTAAACATQTQLKVINRHKLSTLVMDVDLAGGSPRKLSERQAALEGVSSRDAGTEPLLLGVIAAASSDIGDYTKTDFKPSYKWSAGGSSGDFSLAYPMGVPPVPGNLVPEIALSYSSARVDGQTVGVNVQPFWGEGWSFTQGYIERAYRSCKDETANSPVYTITTSDSCWRLPNARMVLGGKSVELVLGNDGVWRSDNDDAARVELLSGGTGTGYHNNERWKVSTADGTVYYFGLTRLPGWTDGDRTTNSTLGIPVFSNHSGDPCLNAQGTGWTNSWCMMAYRWNLDYVVDRNGNTMSFWYHKETNNTARAGNATTVSTYDRYGVLERIDYGTRGGTGATRESRPNATPPARVVLAHVDRCLSGACSTHDRANYPDTAWDLNCSATSCANNMVPSFWSARRISQIATEIYSGSATTFNRVDEWALGAEFPADASGNPLWVSSITRTGKVGGSTTMPSMQFFGTRLRNRADWDPNGTMADPMKYRITRLRNETGGEVEVTYAAQDAGCQFGGAFPDPDNNYFRCFPRYWSNPTGTPGWAWWHKYVVDKVVERDLVGGTPEKQSSFAYTLDGAGSSTGPIVLWGHDLGASVFSSSTNFRSWADWRGYPTVTTTVGTVAGQQSQTKALYFRGLNGDRTDNGYYARNATTTNSLGEVSVDEPQYAGVPHETQTLNGPAGQVMAKTINTMTRWLTGTRDMTNSWAIPPTQWSYLTRATRDRSMTWLPLTSTWRTIEKATTWNTTYGVIDTVDDLGDAGPAADDQCTRHFYTFPGTGAPYLAAYPHRVQKVGVKCSTTPTFPADGVSDVRMFYDGAATYTTAPVKGNITKKEAARSYTGTTPNLITTETNVYDAWGRTTSVKDALNHEDRSVYTHVGGLVSQINSFNALNHETIRTIDKSRGLALTTTDSNLKVTTAQYDPLGRLRKMWKPGQVTSGTPDIEYLYTMQQGAPSYIQTLAMGPNGNQISSFEIFDGLLRKRQSQTTAPHGNRVIEDHQFDRRALEWKTSVFYNAASGPNWTLYDVDAIADGNIDRQTRTLYDQLGRKAEEEQWSRNVFKYEVRSIYEGDRTTTVPPAGGTATTDIVDGRGRLAEKRLYHTTDLSGTFDATTYTYNKAGLLATVKDPLNNQWSYEYDLFEQKTKSIDPDTGTSWIFYDNAGRLQYTQDGSNEQLWYEYDDLDRRTKVRADSATNPPQITIVYDTIAKGQVTSSTRHDSTGNYVATIGGYDNGYRPTSTTYSIPGFGTAGGTLSYTIDYTYKNNGATATATRPGVGGLPVETLAYSYTNSGVSTTLSGASTYIYGTTYGYDGKVSQHVLGAVGKQVRVSTTLDPTTRNPTVIKTETETATQGTFAAKYVSDYAYDFAGNLTGAGTIVNGTRDQFECFRYDYLRRLTEAWTQSAGGSPMCQGTKKTGAEAYWRTWSYDKIGNRTEQVEKNANGTAAITWNYLVGTANGVKPHQLKSVTATGLPTRNFAYHNDGNMFTHTTEAGVAQTLNWNKEGKLASVVQGSDTTNYIYDTDGSRLVSRNATKDVLYLPDGTELEKTSGGILGTRYIGGVAVRTSAGLKWTVGNRQGTSVCQIDSVTLAVTSRRSMPSGEPRGTQPTWTGTKGYLGGTTDSSGLTHLGAREYDPSLGRFTAGDPVMDLTDPQQWHAYAYANNNPSSFADPTGNLYAADSEGRFLYSANGTAMFRRPQPILPPRTFTPRPRVTEGLPKIPRVGGMLGTAVLILSLAGDSPKHQPEEVTQEEIRLP